jgi:hypothetical protein
VKRAADYDRSDRKETTIEAGLGQCGLTFETSSHGARGEKRNFRSSQAIA